MCSDKNWIHNYFFCTLILHLLLWKISYMNNKVIIFRNMIPSTFIVYLTQFSPKLTSHANFYSSSRNLMKWDSGALHAQGPSLTWHKSGMVVHIYNSSAQKVKEGLEVQGYPQFHSKLKATLEYMRSCEGEGKAEGGAGVGREGNLLKYDLL